MVENNNNTVQLPHHNYFKFGNYFTGSITKGEEILNFYITFSEEKRFLCKTWTGLVCSEKAENIIENIFETRENILEFLNNN